MINLLFTGSISKRSFLPFTLFLCSLALIQSCGDNKENETSPELRDRSLLEESYQVFQLISPEQSGVMFKNEITSSKEFNIFKYIYFYNGGGVAIGDFNGDSLQDIYFTANQHTNKLFMNKGAFKFEETTTVSGVAGDAESWNTGCTVVDINGDGRLDLYVSELGNYQGYFGSNKLYINKGNNDEGTPVFEEKSREYGLNLNGFSTQAAFFDMDLDGDLDMYMLNHSVHSNGTYTKRHLMEGKTHQLAGDKLMRNDNGHFVDVSAEAGIRSNALGYGLGLSIGDINNDGLPDIYVGNDFHENDYLYLNKGGGVFKDISDSSFAHTSRFSMGNDIADINNDGLNDLVSLDMLPYDYELLKSATSEDDYLTHRYKLRFGYNHQYVHNSLQLNNGNNTFSEIGLQANMYATDWSWTALLEDYDQDGAKDLFITNGIKRRPNDKDFVNYISFNTLNVINESTPTIRDLALIDTMPSLKIPNFVYRNNQGLGFVDASKKWGINSESFSNGAAYGDLDNDGDLDLVVNNIDDFAFIYENKSQQQENKKPNYIAFKLHGDSLNTQGIGTRITCYASGKQFSKEVYATRGFQSAVQTDPIIALGPYSKIDSVVVIWPNHQKQTLKEPATNKCYSLNYKSAQGKHEFLNENNDRLIFTKSSKELFSIPFLHRENTSYYEFARDALIPHMTSREGPCIAVGDVNGDGTEDIYFGGAKHQPGALYLQKESKFELAENPDFVKDQRSEDVEAQLLDIDGDKDLDLLVASGGNEYTIGSEEIKPRIYLNDGKGNMTKKEDAFDSIYVNAGALATHDFDQDGDTDIFIGSYGGFKGYGIVEKSYLLENNGKGKFRAAEVPESLSNCGMITDAKWGDMDKDGLKDLVIVGEWLPITIFKAAKGSLKNSPTQLKSSKGFWYTIELADMDKDGSLDIIAGNLGQNTKLKASANAPLKMYIADFDDNKHLDHILTYKQNGEERLFATKDELSKQFLEINQKYPSYRKFGAAKFNEIIADEWIKKATTLVIEETSSCIFSNKGNLSFSKSHLPPLAQIAPVKTILVHDINNDGYQDLIMGGNIYDVNVQCGRYDASKGLTLLNTKGKSFKGLLPYQSGLNINGQLRDLKLININKQTNMVAGLNNENPLIYTINNN